MNIYTIQHNYMIGIETKVEARTEAEAQEILYNLDCGCIGLRSDYLPEAITDAHVNFFMQLNNDYDPEKRS